MTATGMFQSDLQHARLVSKDPSDGARTELPCHRKFLDGVVAFGGARRRGHLGYSQIIMANP